MVLQETESVTPGRAQSIITQFQKTGEPPPHAGATLTPKQAKIIKGSKIMGPAWLTHKHRQIPSEENISKKKKKSIK